MKTFLALLVSSLSLSAFGDPFGSPSFWSNRDLVLTNFAMLNVTGSFDVYTCPNGYMATVTLVGATTNLTAVTYTPRVATNGTYYNFGGASLTTNTPAVLSVAGSAGVIYQNEICAVTVTAPINLNVTVIAWPISDYPAVAPRLYTFASGNNTFYQCPAGVRAVPTDLRNPAGNTYSNGSLLYRNDSGSTREIKVYLVPSGASPDPTNQLCAAQVTTASSKTVTIPVLNPSDSIILNVDAGTATQTAVMLPLILRTFKASP